MGLTTRSCRLGGTISARMKRWQLSRSTVVCVIGLPDFGLCGVESARDGRRHHRTVCRLSRQSNSDKTHLATGCLIPSPLEYLLHVGYPGKKRLGGNRLGRIADDVGAKKVAGQRSTLRPASRDRVGSRSQPTSGERRSAARMPPFRGGSSATVRLTEA